MDREGGIESKGWIERERDGERGSDREIKNESERREERDCMVSIV